MRNPASYGCPFLLQKKKYSALVRNAIQEMSYRSLVILGAIFEASAVK